MESNEVKQSPVDILSLDIKELASVQAYESHQAGTLDLHPGPMDVIVLSTRQGRLDIITSFIPHPLQLNGTEAIFLAFPKGAWEGKVVYAPDTVFYITQLDVATLHRIINPAINGHQVEGASRLNMKNLMKLIPLNPSLLICYDQLFHHKLQDPFASVFEQAKFLEIFSLMMDSAFGQQVEVCPVALSPAIEYKIHQVRRHIVENVDIVPDPEELAFKFDLPRNTLKEGYRYIYGKTIHQFHADHKLESAMQMLATGEMLVKEVAFKIGYQNPSHFIAAFKKKFGYTPKQYIKR